MRQFGIVIEQALEHCDRGFVVAAIRRQLDVSEGDSVIRRLTHHLRVKALLLVGRVLRLCRLKRDEQRKNRRTYGKQTPSQPCPGGSIRVPHSKLQPPASAEENIAGLGSQEEPPDRPPQTGSCSE